MGRKREKNPKKVVKSLRFTTTDWQKIKTISSICDVTPSEYIRSLILRFIDEA